MIFFVKLSGENDIFSNNKGYSKLPCIDALSGQLFNGRDSLAQSDASCNDQNAVIVWFGDDFGLANGKFLIIVIENLALNIIID